MIVFFFFFVFYPLGFSQQLSDRPTDRPSKALGRFGRKLLDQGKTNGKLFQLLDTWRVFNSQCCKMHSERHSNGEAGEDGLGPMLPRRHHRDPEGDGPAPQRHPDLHGPCPERVRGGQRVQHRQHPHRLRAVQFGPPYQPKNLPPPSAQRLPGQRWQAHCRGAVRLLPVRQHLQLPPRSLPCQMHARYVTSLDRHADRCIAI